ncbi:MAG TPA: MlaD family protein [Myxococcaceae bacterium]|nr:MlaD family protein [Myxococcaceae bacterium]
MANPTETATQRERRLIVRAGLFVGLALVLFGFVVLLIGKENRLFDRQVRYHAFFENVEGLKRDSPVWLGGLEVGRVVSISFSPDLGDKKIDVMIEMSKTFAPRVRTDCVARVGGRGVLGDKAIDISLGTSEGDPIPIGGAIPSGSSGDLTALLKSGGALMDNLVAASENVKKLSDAFADPAVAKDLTAAISSSRSILQGIEKGNGVLHALIYDPKGAGETHRLLVKLADVSVQAERALEQVSMVLEAARKGDGALHALLYDPKAGKAVGQLGDAAGEIAILLHDARTSPNGAIHELVYGDARDLFKNLGAMSEDLRVITGKIRAGEGTLGALVVDPSVYDDLRTVLGNVKRNKVLQELVRITVSNKGGLEQAGKPTDGHSPLPNNVSQPPPPPPSTSRTDAAR